MTEANWKITMKEDLMLDLERKIEKTIYKATLALDENNWSEFFELCGDSFTYAITSFSPEINKNMTYFSGDKKEFVGLMDKLPKQNTDHSPLHIHTSVYSVDIAEGGKSATAISSVTIYQNMLDGINSHLDSGESRLFVIGKYIDQFSVINDEPTFTNRETKLVNRRIDKGSHWLL